MRRWLEEYIQAQPGTRSNSQQRGRDDQWKPPSKGTYSVTVFGACKEEKAGVGVVFRNSDGTMLVSMAGPLPGITVATQAEVYAIWRV